MTGKQLAISAVRIAGLLIGIYVLVAIAQSIARHPWSAWHPWSWLVCSLVTAWALVLIFMVAWPAHVACRLAGRRVSSEQTNDWDNKVVEGIGQRLLGIYFLVQAAVETAHVGIYQIAFQLHIREFWGLWADKAPDDIASTVVSSVIKTFVGGWLVVGSRNILDALRWARTAGRHWKLD